MEFSGGFHTLDQAVQLRPFGRGSFWVAETHKGTAAIAYDWVSSVFNQTSIAAYTQIHNGADNWDPAADARGPNYTWAYLAMIPYVDTASGTPTLKISHSGHTGHAADDFGSVDTGVQAADDNNWLNCLSTTGVTFSGGNMVDGDHVIKWKHRHDAKTDTYFTVTAVMWAASNVLEARAHWTSRGSSTADDYVTTAYAKTSGTLYWKATWDPSDNTWTIQEQDTDWAGLASGNVSTTTSGGKLTKQTSAYLIDGSSPSDYRMWEIEVGVP